jgi:RNA polymerase sigma factor (sigma-70 family)
MLDLDRHLPAIAAADPDAFGDWAGAAEGELRDALRGFAAAVDVEAVLQEALLRAWQLAPRLEPDGRPNALLRYAVRAARNLAVDEARRRRRIVAPGDDELHRRLDRLAEAGPAAPDPLLRRLIRSCFDALPSKPRLALVGRLASAGGEPDRATAARLGMRPNTFLQNFTRARRLLAECLKGRGVALDEVSP